MDYWCPDMIISMLRNQKDGRVGLFILLSWWQTLKLVVA